MLSKLCYVPELLITQLTVRMGFQHVHPMLLFIKEASAAEAALGMLSSHVSLQLCCCVGRLLKREGRLSSLHIPPPLMMKLSTTCPRPGYTRQEKLFGVCAYCNYYGLQVCKLSSDLATYSKVELQQQATMLQSPLST